MAKTALSLLPSCSTPKVDFTGLVAVVDLGRDVIAADFAGRDADFVTVAGASGSTRSNSLRVTTVAAVQVAVDETAALTASVLACNEAMGKRY